jgi:transposase
MFTGYNVVTGTGKRDRAGCLAHVRRRFFDALPYAPEGKLALELIRDVYVVEHDAIAAGVAGTDEHRRMRQARTGPIMARLMTWLEEQKPLHLPKGPMGSAVAYALNHWTELTRFIENPGIPPDNNRSESALRVVALGRNCAQFQIMRSTSAVARNMCGRRALELRIIKGAGGSH